MKNNPQDPRLVNKEPFTLALDLPPEWHMVRTEINKKELRLDVFLAPTSDRLPCPECLQLAPRYDSNKEREWRHIPFWQYHTYIHASLPRVKCPEHGVLQVAIPWARPKATFTLLFEGIALSLIKEMPVLSVARHLGVTDHRLHRMVGYYMSQARKGLSLSTVRRVGIDETASRRGHHYVSIFVDLDSRNVIYCTTGRSHETLGLFAEELKRCGGDPANITEISIDMSNAYIKGAEMFFPNAAVAFDKFHVMQMMNKAVDEVRRDESSEHKELLAKTRFLWLKNRVDLHTQQKQVLDNLLKHPLKTGRAYMLKVSLQQFYRQPKVMLEPYLKKWYFWATHCRIIPVIDVAATIKNHWKGIINAATTGTTNGILEGYNSLVQAAKAKARGYRNAQSFINVIYLIGGGLDFLRPTHSVE